jgi:DNA helicase HerA-like ATPase
LILTLASSPPKKTVGAADLKDKLLPDELIERFLARTPFVDFLRTPLPVAIPHRSRFEHTHIVAGTGHGKTQLLQYLILNDLPHIAAGKRSVVVIDSQGSDSQRGLINEILSLAAVGAMADRVVLIDPKEYTPALNLFDFGLDRLKGYKDQQKRKQVLNGAIELYEYMFGALLRAEVTMRQDTIFSNLARLMMVIPGATIDDLLNFLEHPEMTRQYLHKLDELDESKYARRFFETSFSASKYSRTREQLADRLEGLLTKTDLASMFAAKRNKLDLFSAMNRGSLILISTNKNYLNQDASEIFGRFFIALIRQAARERELGDQGKLTDTFVYIDEAHEYFDESLGNLFEQVRKFQVGMVIAHQHLGQFKNGLDKTVTGNTSVKIAGGISYDDARDLAKNMGRNCTPDFLLSMQKYLAKKETEFACFVKNIEGLPRAIPLRVPLGAYDHQPKMSAFELALLKKYNRARYGATDERPPDKPKDDDSPLGEPELL